MSKEEEQLFQQSSSCWICKKLINNDDEKARDYQKIWKNQGSSTL